jgi:hypothetical protein
VGGLIAGRRLYDRRSWPEIAWGCAEGLANALNVRDRIRRPRSLLELARGRTDGIANGLIAHDPYLPPDCMAPRIAFRVAFCQHRSDQADTSKSVRAAVALVSAFGDAILINIAREHELVT